MKGRALIAGFATRHVAGSAFRAGWEVCAVDHFCDQDLAWYTKDRKKFEELEELPDAIDTMCREYRFDWVIPTSGAEDFNFPVPVCGTPKEKIGKFLDKLDIQHFFEENNIPVPRIVPQDHYPHMLKPRKGAGGWRNARIHNDDENAAWENLFPDTPAIRQEFVEGIPASVCCVADGSRARALAANEQILHGDGATTFGFCGSLTPFVHPLRDRMIAMAERVAAASGCTGTVGIDFVVGDNSLHAIEINPRFQGTVDTVEAATGISIFDVHVNACRGVLPESVHEPQQVAARSILFADSDFTLREDLSPLAPVVADIPWPGTEFEKDQAIVSVYGRGADRAGALAALDKHISTVRQYMR